jgi:hypothetical protein
MTMRRHLRLTSFVLQVAAALLLSGCGGKEEMAGSPTEVEPAAPTVSPDDLREAEKVTRAYCEALVKGDYAEAVSHLEGAASLSEEQRRGFEQQLRTGAATMGLTRVTSIGPARQDPQSPRNILVPYSVAGKKTLTGDAIVRRSSPEGGWAVSGGI